MTHPLWETFAARGVPLAAIPGERTVAPASFGDDAAEHLHTRCNAGLFDFSFMTWLEVAGPGARTMLDRLQTRSLARLPPGRLAYTLLLAEDGGVRIDATVWCLAADRYWLFTGRRSDAAWIAACATARAWVTDRSEGHAVLAVQGPASARVLERALGGHGLAALRYFGFLRHESEAGEIFVARLGYTGERGYELLLPAQRAPALWARLAADAEVRECGFAAADALRIEAGYILFGNELRERASPYELRLERLLEFDDRDWVGRTALAAQRFRQPARRFVGLRPVDSARPRRRADLPPADVTSSGYSPIYRSRLALGFVAADACAPGTLVDGGELGVAVVCRLPFHDPPRMLPRRGGEA